MDILTRGLVWEGDGKIVKRPKKKGTCLVIGGASFIYAYGKDYSKELGETRVVGWGCFFLFGYGIWGFIVACFCDEYIVIVLRLLV